MFLLDYTAAPSRDRVLDPTISTFRKKTCSTIQSERVTAQTITNPLDHTYTIKISAGYSGMTKRCSIVPCWHSSMSTAPVRMIVC